MVLWILLPEKFREGKPKDYLYKGCRTPWGGYKEPYNDLVEFLLSSLDGDEEKVAYLQRLLGYSLFGEVVEQVFSNIHREGP